MAVVGSMVTEQQRHLTTLFSNDKHATIHHKRSRTILSILKRRFQDIDDLNGPIDDYATRHIDEKSVLGQHSVQTSDGIAVGCQSVVMVRKE